MASFLKCPGCGEGLDVPDALCVGCGRVRPPEEIAAGEAEAERLARKESLARTGKLTAKLAVAGLLLWAGRPYLQAGRDAVMRRLDAVSNTDRPISPMAAEIVDKLATAKHLQPVARGAVAVDPNDPGMAKYGREVAEMNATRGGAPGAAPDARAAEPAGGEAQVPAFDPNMGRPDWNALPKTKATPPPTPAESAAWRTVYGVVYDLKTGMALPGVRVEFLVEAMAPLSTSTDEKGHYAFRAMNNVDGSLLTARVVAPGYGGQVEDGDPPWYERTQRERDEYEEQLSSYDIAAQPVRFKDSDRTVRFDLAVVKARKER